MGHWDHHACQAYAALGSGPGLMVAAVMAGATAFCVYVLGLG